MDFSSDNDSFWGEFDNFDTTKYLFIERNHSPISGRVRVAGGIYNESKPKIRKR